MLFININLNKIYILMPNNKHYMINIILIFLLILFFQWSNLFSFNACLTASLIKCMHYE